jgi:hypothetical protein
MVCGRPAEKYDEAGTRRGRICVSKELDMVNLDELEAQWAEHDRKLDANLRLSRRLLSASTLKRARSALQRLIAFVAIESLATLAGSTKRAAPRFS